MLDFILSEPMLFLYAFLLGMFFKSMILDKIKAYIVAKLAPGIIKKYLEEALGMNQDVLPAAVIVSAAPVVAPAVIVAAPAQVIAPVEASIAPPAA